MANQDPACRIARPSKATAVALAVAGALSLVLLLGAACGGDDDDSTTSSSPTSGSPTRSSAAGSGSATPTEPAGTATPPPGTRVQGECATPEAPSSADPSPGFSAGLLSDLVFSGEDGQYAPGEEIGMTLTLLNCGDNDVHLYYPTSQRYVFIAENEETGVEVWRSSDESAFQQVEGEEVFAPEESLVYQETWDQKDRDGVQVPPARYKISGFSVGCGTEIVSECRFGPVQFIDITG